MSRQSILNEYIRLVGFLEKILSSDYELVLNDISNPDASIIAVANGHITNRKVGGPLSTFALKLLYDHSHLQQDWYVNYRGITKNNRSFRSSTYFIKDEDGELVGMLCINYDDSKYAALAQQLVKLGHPTGYDIPNLDHDASLENSENFTESIVDIIKAEIDLELSKSGIIFETLSHEQRKTLVQNFHQKTRIEIVQKLDMRGVFMLKGAVYEVALQLHCSETTVYRYLNKR